MNDPKVAGDKRGAVTRGFSIFIGRGSSRDVAKHKKGL
jgi:hypothetical protein